VQLTCLLRRESRLGQVAERIEQTCRNVGTLKIPDYKTQAFLPFGNNVGSVPDRCNPAPLRTASLDRAVVSGDFSVRKV
jgi:hypothetical protein